ncbi:MAG: hypothetical protein IKV87_06050 [Methanobrevibacter sp.]|nr:hypothetical protein [Methanobrevibacter sp.]
MKAIILNSGMGTRLGNLTKENPKSLVSIGEDETIFSNAISILSQFDIDEFILTTGYLADVLKDYALNKFPNVNFTFVHNPVYDKTNYIKSLDYISDINDDVILLHGDLVFTFETAKKVIGSEFSSIVVDTTIPIPKDDFKAKLDNNLIKYIGVDYFEEDAVSCQAFYKMKKSFWQNWKKKINEFCLNGATDVYAENALNVLLDDMDLNALDLKGSLCMEVDTVEDLEIAKELIKI